MADLLMVGHQSELNTGKRGYWAVIFLQQFASIGNNLIIQIVAGICMKLILSQLPDISSLKEINLICTLCTISFAIGCVAMSIYNGYAQVERSSVTYAVLGDAKHKAFNIMFSLGLISFTFGDTVLPEVQATLGGDAKKEMYKGISCAYPILLSSYMAVAVSGYWAFGYHVRDFVAFVGAFGMMPIVVIMPIVLWQKVDKRSQMVSMNNWNIVGGSVAIAVAGVIGSVQAIIADVGNYTVFADLF
ncbi:probable GABA transporter 1 [Coccomyxa sp. Obi]|nr:probable GABA transporter 1 [Coccomyxa sp. Obi]